MKVHYDIKVHGLDVDDCVRAATAAARRACAGSWTFELVDGVLVPEVLAQDGEIHLYKFECTAVYR